MEDFPLNSFYQDIYTSYDRVNRAFTFGRDKYWRKQAALALLKAEPGVVLDLCTGTGDFVLELARRSASQAVPPVFTGYDFTAAMLDEAKKKYAGLSGQSALPDISFIEGDAAEMPFKKDQFDALGITFGIRNLVYENSRADKHLSEIARVLKPGGRLVVLESSMPANPIWRFFNNIYLRFLLPLIGGSISGNWKAYRYLSSSSKNYYTRKQMSDILEKTGFKTIESRALFLGSVMLLVAEKK